MFEFDTSHSVLHSLKLFSAIRQLTKYNIEPGKKINDEICTFQLYLHIN